MFDMEGAGSSPRVSEAMVSARSEADTVSAGRAADESRVLCSGLVMEESRGGAVAGLIMTEDEREGMDTLLLELRMEADRACPARLVGGEPGVGMLDAGGSRLAAALKDRSPDCIAFNILREERR